MRTLKRTLCLVLAMVMVLGMFGIASATSFKDDGKVQYKEAVDVMTGIGSINGMGDGTFNPAGNVTRAQAAKMVAYAVLGADVAKTLPVTASSFKDVDSNFNWAIPSIEYLVKRGVINGRGNGTFDPNGNITAYEIAKMLLCAAGYGKNGEYTGNSWMLNVAITAQKQGVFTGSKTTDRSAAATREECALYCFNVLTKVTMVNYDKTKDAYVDVSPAKNIGEAVYGLAIDSADKEDAFKRPASKWNVDTAKVPNLTNPIASTAATSVASYKDASYAKAFAANTYEFDAGVKIYVNGAAYNTNDPSVLASRKLNGTGIELYNTDTDKDIDVIVLTQAYLAKVIDYTATKGTAYGNFKIEAYNPWAGAKATLPTVTDTKKTDDLFDKMLSAGLEKGDYLLVYTEGADLSGKIMKFAEAGTVTGALSTYTATDNADGFNGSVTVGGTKYTLASACVENKIDGFISNDGAGDYAMSKYLTKNVTCFIDEYGMVIGIVPEKVEETTNLVYVVNAYIKNAYDAYGKPIATYWVQCVDMTGAEVNYQVNQKELKTIATTTEDSGIVNGITATTKGLYAVQTSTDATLKATVADFTVATSISTNTKTTNAGSDTAALATTSVKVADGNYFDANTTFLFVKDSGATLKVTKATGVQATNGTNTYYYFGARTSATTGNFTVKYVVVDGAPIATPAQSLMFVPQDFNTNSAVSYTKADGTTDTAYKNVAFIDGTPKTDVIVTDASSKAGFYTYSVDATTGIYTLTPANTGFGSGTVKNVYGNLVSLDAGGKFVVDLAAYKTAAASDPSTTTGLDVVNITDIDATGAFIVDVPYLADMLQNGGAGGLTQITTLNGLLKTSAVSGSSNAQIAFTWKANASGDKVITGIYVTAQPVNK